jgi:hypothetical protein
MLTVDPFVLGRLDRRELVGNHPRHHGPGHHQAAGLGVRAVGLTHGHERLELSGV